MLNCIELGIRCSFNGPIIELIKFSSPTWAMRVFCASILECFSRIASGEVVSPLTGGTGRASGWRSRTLLGDDDLISGQHLMNLYDDDGETT